METQSQVCPFCKEIISDNEPSCKIKEKGALGINKKSLELGDSLTVEAGIVVHVLCRQKYLKKDPNKVKQSTCEQENIRTRQSTGGFNFKTDCFFCGFSITEKEKLMNKYCNVASKDIAILKAAESRGNDSWAVEVKGRLESVSDLRAVDAVYHRDCNTRFRMKRPKASVRGDATSENKKRGRPVELSHEAAFEEVCSYLQENDDEQITVSELASMMDNMLSSSSTGAYSTRWLQIRLLERFQDQIIISNINGKPNVVTFAEKVSNILSEFKKREALSDEAEQSEEDKKIDIIGAAAKIIRSDVKRLELSKDYYPSSEEMESISANEEYLPESLKVFLTTMFGQRKLSVHLVAAIGQSIMQQIRPRAIVPPLQIGLAVQMHKHFASRFLIDTLNTLGFCSSYHEVQKFERSAACFQGTDIPISNGESVFMQYSADNVDHNTITLTGEGTFHGMGIIVSVTPRLKYKSIVPRLKDVSTDDLLSRSAIESHILPRKQSPKTKFNLLPKEITERNNSFHNVWACTWLLQPESPQWNGFMQMVSKGEHPGVATILFMPMIDQKSTDPVCILSTMKFVCKQAAKYNMIPVLTFDQPLYWKAMEIKLAEGINSDISTLVVRIGVFHMCMSFLGAAGHLMQGSGLKSIFEMIYAENSVPQIFNGKAVSRATRAHLLLYGTLIGMKVAKQLNIKLLNEEDNVCEELQPLLKLYKKLVNEENFEEEEGYREVTQLMDNIKNAQTSPTSKLWVQYLDIIEIFCRCIKAERSGNWEEHLQATRDMMPYLASSGHYLYLKSAYLYLQTMMELPATHPTLFKKFTEGYHVVRRSDRFWAGLSTDLVIEQVLMRSLKTVGGLTRGRGMTDTQRAVWLLSTPVTSEVNRAMQQFTGVAYETSEQHKETADSRVKKDHEDAQKLVEYLLEHNPFEGFDELVNIHTGEVADKSVNVYNARDIGEKIIESMIGVNVFSYSFKRKDMVITMKTNSSIVIEDERVHVDPMLLFQRLVLIMGKTQEKMEDAFSFELSTLPASLFDKEGLMRIADKPPLAAEISKIVGNGPQTVPEDTHYVLDGGYLLQRIPWKKGRTFLEICQSYVAYITSHYGVNTTIVFDGYAPSTKDTTHIRRAKGKVGKTILLSLHNKLTVAKEDLLVNAQNKESFIHMLGEECKKSNINVEYCESDADLLVVMTALEIARNHIVTVIGEDTDILALLLYHKSRQSNKVYYTSEQKANAKSKPRIWDIENTKKKLGKDVCDNILTLHVVTGCDTTSRIHSIGKGKILQKFISSDKFCKLTKELGEDNKTPEAVMEVGEKLLLHIMGAKKENTLDELRLSKYYRKIAECKVALTPETLGPTSDAGKLHSLRTYHQLQAWKGNNDLVLEKWGWKKTAKFILPIPMTKAPAPSELLKVIRCTCTTGCNNRCGCVKIGVKCSSICSGCRGVSCCNCEEVIVEHDDR